MDYSEGIVRRQPNVIITKELSEAIGQDFRTLPIFEKSLYEYTYIQHYSLERNELLKSRWTKYKREFGNRVFAPFQFLNIRDYHFHNCQTRLRPASIHERTEHRRTLRPGPGVDSRGEIPIPQELLMRRGEQKAGMRNKGKVRKQLKEERKNKKGEENGE